MKNESYYLSIAATLLISAISGIFGQAWSIFQVVTMITLFNISFLLVHILHKLPTPSTTTQTDEAASSGRTPSAST